MTRDQIIQHLTQRGYTVSPRSNELYTKPGVTGWRYRLGRLVMRREHKLSTGEWVRARSGYYRHLGLNADGKITGLTISGQPHRIAY